MDQIGGKTMAHAIIRDGRRYEVDFGDSPVRVEVYASETTIECPKNLQRGDDLRPNRNHAQKQCQTSNRSGFLNDGADHVSSPLNMDGNIVTFGLFHVDLDQLR